MKVQDPSQGHRHFEGIAQLNSKGRKCCFHERAIMAEWFGELTGKMKG